MTAAYHHTGVFSIKNPTIESEVSWSSLLSFYTLEEQSFQQYLKQNILKKRVMVRNLIKGSNAEDDYSTTEQYRQLKKLLPK